VIGGKTVEAEKKEEKGQKTPKVGRRM